MPLYVNKLYNIQNEQIPRKIQTIKLTQEEIDNLNKPITSKEIELVIFFKIPTKNTRTKWLS